jgi:SAM-dependent methyltransferase
MDPYLRTNLARWNELVSIHARSAFYNLDEFKRGKCSLKSIEVGELGDVAGKSLLHLQCHFGMDTLSWARRGARVTGVDFSEEAVAQARALGRELGIPADFVCADVRALAQHLTGTFDIVFTSYGVLCWLPDLLPWAQTIARFLKPGGFFYLVETHPLITVFEEQEGHCGLKVAYSYCHSPEPVKEEVKGSYADRTADVKNKVDYTWQHSLGDILSALGAVGLCLEFLHEFPFLMFPLFPSMTQGEDGWWRLPGRGDMLPMLFSVKAAKEATG